MMKSNSVFLTVALSVLTWVGSHNALALSPPWFILQNEMMKTIGASRCVEVEELKPVTGGFDLDVEVCNRHRAQALATLIFPTRDFGGVMVHIRVFDHHHLIAPEIFPTNPSDAAEEIERALRGNRYFVQVDPRNVVFDLFIEFRPRVVQFFADDISDFYNNHNLVAAAAFEDALGLSFITGIKVGVTTSPIHHDLID